MTTLNYIAWLFDHALMAQDRAAIDFGATIHRGKVLVHWPTLFPLNWRAAPREWAIGAATTWHDFARLFRPFLPPPVLGEADPLVQTYASMHGRPASEFSAFDLHRAPLLASAGLVRPPEAIALYESHWVRQALWAFKEVDEGAAAEVGVFVHPDTSSVIIHWPTRAELYPFQRLPFISKRDTAYDDKAKALRLVSRAPQQHVSQSLAEVKRLFDRHPCIRKAGLPNRVAKVRSYAAYAASPWVTDRSQCSILDAQRFVEALKAQSSTDARRQRRLRFTDVFLSDLLQVDPHLGAHAPAMAALEAAGVGALRIHIRPVRAGWFLALPGCFNGLLGDTDKLESDVAAFHQLAARASDQFPSVTLDGKSFDIIDDRVFMNADGLLNVLKFTLPRKEPVLGLIAYYNKLLSGMPLPKFRVEIQPLEKRRYEKNGHMYVKRGAAWTPNEDDVLYNWFSPDDHGKRHRLGETEWRNLLAQLPGRTRDAIRVRLTALNNLIIIRLKGEKGTSWKKHFPMHRLGQLRGPAPVQKDTLPAAARHIVSGSAAN